MNSDFKKYLATVGTMLVLGFGFFYSGLIQRTIDIAHGTTAQILNNLQLKNTNGRLCEAPTRPFAVMISSDAEARPLSGIGQADLVFEMPVTDSGVTRMMAVFECVQPKEIGSIRSSRIDFIPLAQGLGAIYAHWGGEHQALIQLNNRIIDNIDGLKYDGTVFFRKPSAPRPHNGFTSFELLKKFAEDHQYNIGERVQYIYDAKDESKGTENPPSLYRGEFTVDWTYSEKENIYTRQRGAKDEIDKTTQSQVSAKNIIIMKTTWSPISKDYIRVQTLSSGDATIYQNGVAILGRWKKDSTEKPLQFFNEKGDTINLVKGSTWIEIDARGTDGQTSL